MLLTGGDQAHTSLALYLVVRGLVLLVRCGNLPEAHPLKRALLAPTRVRHGDALLMCLSTAQLAYSWICLPQVGPPREPLLHSPVLPPVLGPRRRPQAQPGALTD